MHAGTEAKSDTKEPMSTGDMVATLMPLFFLVVMFVVLFRFMIRSSRRAVDCMKQNDQMIALLTEIRDLLSRGSR
jgi:preprotein translocase subunit YajC